MENKRHTGKVVKYPRSLTWNLGMMIFAVILIYVVICVISFFRAKRIVGYEVKEGSLSNNHIYNDAIALRDEEIVPADTAGYINYFVSEGTRVGVGNLVYTIDESGGMQDLLLSEGTDTIRLTASDLSELRPQVVQFTSSFAPNRFSSVYHFRNTIQGTAQKLTNARILDNMKAINDNRVQSIGYYHAPFSGTVLFYTDGYETKTPQDLTADLFDREAYTREIFTNDQLVEGGVPAYKVVTNENWKVVFRTDEKTADALLKEGYIKVRFLKNQYEAWGEVSVAADGDGEPLVVLSFTHSMEIFSTDRFLSIELLLQEQRGLKVPLSAIVEKSFYLVPEAYVTMGTDVVQGVMKRIYQENGQSEVTFSEIQIYDHKNETYYIDASHLEAGDLLYLPGTQETYTIEQQETLRGVYNINKGYADFRQIELIADNEEYAIVKSDTLYGLSVYDHIVLDASAVSDDELIFD